MRRRILLIVFSCVLLILSLVIFDRINARNAAPMPVPSVSGGYYENGFTLRLTAPSNGSIYYTTDGSTPTADSTLYQDGIPLKNRSSEQNLYNSVQNVVTDWKNYTPDPQPVEKGTVIRAVFVNERDIASEILTQTYFIGLQPPERGYTLSLVFEYDDLFGEDGIYVTGKEYDEWYLSGDSSTEAPVPNFEKKREVRATAELLGESGDILNQAVGLRLQGNTARAERNKRLTIAAREEYSGSNTFQAALYEGISTHAVMLKSYFPDTLASRLVSNRSVSVQGSIPVKVFLNGEFLYNSYMLERYDKQYFRQHYNVDGFVLVKDGAVHDEDISSADNIRYQEYMGWVADTDFSDPQEWEAFQEETDVQSYIDYVVTNYYLCNIDLSDNHNYVLWRSASRGKSPYADQRWRWCIYDIDALAWMPYRPKYGNVVEINAFSNDFTFDLDSTTLFRSLKSSPEFRERFVLSFMDILNNNFAPANVEEVLADYGYTLDWLDGFFRKRPAYAVTHLAEEFGLTGSLETVTVTTAHPEMGSVTVNTSLLDLSSGSWSGQYFTDYPITVTAAANDGYEFVGWKGDADGAGETVTVSVDGGIALEAVFAKVQ